MCQREVRRSSKDSGKVPKTRKDSCSPSSSRMNSFRRAKSMFSLSTDETDQIQIDVSPVHSHSRKQRANTEKGPGLRRQSEDTETLTPRARAFVPTDYRHYLGMTEKSSAHTSTTLPSKWSKEVKVDYDSSRRGSKTQQHPLSPNYTNSDTFHESLCNASESRPSSRLSSNRENDDSPVKRALRRAEARPKNLAKSLEDITAASTPRSERRQELSVDQRSSSDGSSLPSPLSSLYMDPEHTKKMSKSVPFLQNELSGSVMTIYSGDYGSVEVQGTIHFSIHYVQKLREFHIFVAQCKDLAPVDPKRGRSDPYVKSYLVPDKANLGKRKTSVKKKTLNPTFNEILRYRVRMEYLRTQTLILSVWHHDTFGKNSFLGEIDVDLSKWDFDHTQMNYLALKARTYPTLTPPNCRGEMRIAIRYVPQNGQSDGLARVGPNSGEIHIWVKECKNLPMIRATIDPYVKCFVLPDTSKKSRQKTRILRGTADPVFNHTMVYDGIRQADLTEACVELTVLDRDRLATNLLGGLRLGAGTGRSYGSLVDWMDSTAYEVALWDRMMASPNEWVEDVLPLRWLHSTKTTSK
ncbi:synaptotagmin-like protein 2 [Boleophthalmus pectinirostris]|uniref:synaptotagmin-like protein 2 n=1 Tax=Boleophthalmus pectinirostris TaxID=150288 RepID=UPI00242B4352|nr:synaptotagmin-like protein 2 [Boleophthalmus pectinirostris]